MFYLHVLREGSVLSRDKGLSIGERLGRRAVLVRSTWERVCGQVGHSGNVISVYAVFGVLSYLQRMLIENSLLLHRIRNEFISVRYCYSC